jgi:hypothetical protein
LAMVYSRIDRPETQYHDWLDKAKATLRDLNRSSKVTLSHYSHRYVRPYTNAEYPDSMVQLTVLTPISEYASWSDAPPEAVAFSEELSEGLSRFYDKDLKTMRRYLPNVGEDKDKDEVDSWYLYHPLINLGRLAKAGNTKARKLFFDSLEYGIATAHHFQYQWPIQYNVTTREVVKAERKDGEPGQSDVGGIYAYLMLQAWDLSEDSHYLDEARNALRAASDMEFSMLYQTNLTAWGANASLRLWRITQDEAFRDQSFVFIANYCHNCVLWESQIKAAEHHPVFMGATCLHDGPYLAIYECFESFMAFEEFLALGQDDLPDSVQLLLAEYYKYTLHRAWYFYPSELPEDILAKEIRNGEIDRSLAFPLEDLYASGQAPGSVGQEVYGCGAAFTFVTRAYHQPQGASFLIFAEYPTKTWEQPESSKLIFRTRGVKGYDCKIRIIPVGRAVLPTIYLYETDSTTEPNRLLRGRVTEEGHCEFIVSADNSFLLTWE